ncbi:hypothetical protein CALCODRAFT_497608 [Calocera cornea HHB12733]|uniref:Uncharacterized protein n=1 Tax=Calocera cornea HHB12733 TaxID=1353952 RepID=A0A165F6K7_9BASI|nr:hypothetical protein CALCODRAFT_497608 [Calocera cornea HHB12733]
MGPATSKENGKERRNDQCGSRLILRSYELQGRGTGASGPVQPGAAPSCSTAECMTSAGIHFAGIQFCCGFRSPARKWEIAQLFQERGSLANGVEPGLSGQKWDKSKGPGRLATF